jgi:hypothetical protein
MPIIAGKGAVPVVGYVIVGAKVMDFPASVTVIVSVLPEKDTVMDSGGPGKIPSSSSCRSVLISSLRHAQSDRVRTLSPFTKVNGSGSSVWLNDASEGIAGQAESIIFALEKHEHSEWGYSHCACTTARSSNQGAKTNFKEEEGTILT